MADYLSGRVKDGIGYFHGREVTAFLAGSARSFDALAAMAVIENRAVHGDIRLVLTCRDQTRGRS